MNGWIDNHGRALVHIALKPDPNSSATHLEAWIDTGFTGELVLPETVVSALELPQSAAVTAQLGDGSSVVMNTYTCLIEWFGQERLVEVLANNAAYPLLGIGLLRDHKCTLDYPMKTVVIQ